MKLLCAMLILSTVQVMPPSGEVSSVAVASFRASVPLKAESAAANLMVVFWYATSPSARVRGNDTRVGMNLL